MRFFDRRVTRSASCVSLDQTSTAFACRGPDPKPRCRASDLPGRMQPGCHRAICSSLDKRSVRPTCPGTFRFDPAIPRRSLLCSPGPARKALRHRQLLQKLCARFHRRTAPRRRSVADLPRGCRSWGQASAPSLHSAGGTEDTHWSIGRQNRWLLPACRFRPQGRRSRFHSVAGFLRRGWWRRKENAGRRAGTWASGGSSVCWHPTW